MTSQRRQSVLPTTSHILCKSTSNAENLEIDRSVDKSVIFPTARRRATSAVHSLRRMSNILKSQGPTEALKSALGDPNRARFLQLSMQHEKLAAEWKRINGFLNDLHSEYLESKILDVVRRYRKLQSLAKKIVFHLRLTDPESFNKRYSLDEERDMAGSVLQSSVKQNELVQRHEMICDCFSSEELQIEVRKLEKINKCLREKIDRIVDAINSMDEQYQNNKNDVLVRRYLSLKANVKIVFEINSSP